MRTADTLQYLFQQLENTIVIEHATWYSCIHERMEKGTPDNQGGSSQQALLMPLWKKNCNETSEAVSDVFY